MKAITIIIIFLYSLICTKIEAQNHKVRWSVGMDMGGGGYSIANNLLPSEKKINRNCILCDYINSSYHITSTDINTFYFNKNFINFSVFSRVLYKNFILGLSYNLIRQTLNSEYFLYMGLANYRKDTLYYHWINYDLGYRFNLIKSKLSLDLEISGGFNIPQKTTYNYWIEGCNNDTQTYTYQTESIKIENFSYLKDFFKLINQVSIKPTYTLNNNLEIFVDLYFKRIYGFPEFRLGAPTVEFMNYQGVNLGILYYLN